MTVEEIAQMWIRLRRYYTPYAILRLPPAVVEYLIVTGTITVAEMTVLWEIVHKREIAQWN